MLPNELTWSPQSFEIRNYSSFAALVFLMLEYLSNCDAEYNYIWRSRPTAVKYIYLVSRYAGLIGQIVHYSLIHVLLSDAPVKPEQCRVWFLFLFGVCSVTVATLDAILLLRIYALYRKNAKVHILIIPLVLQFVVGSVVMERVTRSHTFNSQCDKTTSPFEISVMGGCVVLAHAALGVVTYAKRNIAGGRAPVVRLVVREGAWIVFVLSAIVGTAATYAVVFDSANPFAIFVWPTAVMSVITCRIILNMKKLKTNVLPQGRVTHDTSTEFRLSTIYTQSSQEFTVVRSDSESGDSLGTIR